MTMPSSSAEPGPAGDPDADNADLREPGADTEGSSGSDPRASTEVDHAGESVDAEPVADQIKQEVQQQVAIAFSSRRAWHPEPDELDRLKSDHPGVYNEIIDGSREARQLRNEVRRKNASAANSALARGQWFAFIIGLVLAVGSAISLVLGHLVGVAGIVIGIAPIVTAFVGASRNGNAAPEAGDSRPMFNRTTGDGAARSETLPPPA